MSGPDGDAAEFARLRADLALLGHTVARMPSGGFVVARWGLSRYCADLAALRAFAAVVGAEGAR
ncbi:hypothetical protein QTI33_03660 [Variovorax sp. J22P271]|uniref:hypothetical protein n=1 Tax=Variovorax davisae TaxID=3053515 RepID=UPI0025778D34|nr:hypothetical protein [Variovorax sp. J22P271]MDM0031231.1 hypothetical protein [Variovorax sp. J22P271]